jgi:hypothetical protein
MTKIKVVCPMCDGRKQLQMPKFPLTSGLTKVKIPQCDGRGYIEAEAVKGGDTAGRVGGFKPTRPKFTTH